jgi:hypothetical protein
MKSVKLVSPATRAFCKVLLALSDIPQGRHGFPELVRSDGEAIRLVIVLHEVERIEVDIARELDVRLNPPVPLVRLQKRMPVEELQIPSRYVRYRVR